MSDALPRALGSFVTLALGVILAFAAQLALARALGREDYGAYAYGVAWASVLAMFARGGADAVALRVVARAHHDGDEGTVHAFSSWARRRALIVGLCLGLALSLFGWLFAPGDLRGAVSVAGVVVLALGLVHVDAAILQALGRPVAGQVALHLLPRGALLVGAAGLWWAVDAPSSPTAVAVEAVAFALGLALGRSLAPTRAGAPPDGERAREWRRLGWSMLLVTGLQLLHLRSDLLVVGWLAGADAAGGYAAASRLSEVVAFWLAAATVTLPPVLARVAATGERGPAQRQLRRLMGVGLFYVGASAATLYAFDVQVLGLFGERFVTAAPILAVLLLAAVINGVCGAVAYMLVLSGHERVVALGMGVVSVANLVLDIPAVLILGPIGAAWATAVTTTLWNVAFLVMVRRRLGLDPSVLGLLWAPGAPGGRA